MVMSKTNNDISSRCPSWRAKVAGWGLGTQRAWRALYLFTCGISEQVPIFYGMFDIPKHTPIFLGGKWSLVPIVFWFLNISWKLPEMEEYGTMHTMVSSCFISQSTQLFWVCLGCTGQGSNLSVTLEDPGGSGLRKCGYGENTPGQSLERTSNPWPWHGPGRQSSWTNQEKHRKAQRNNDSNNHN